MSWIKDVRHGLCNLNQDRKSLRKFGLVMAVALAVLGFLVFFLGSHPQRAFSLWAVGAAFLIIGLVLPIALRSIHICWMALALSLGWVMSRLILAILFYLVITPIGLIMRLFGYDPLMRKFDPNAQTYWIKREHKVFDPAQYEHQF